MPSQDDNSEEVSVTSLHDVMARMTRRFEELLVKQDERQAKQFAELFDVSFKKIGHSAQSDDVVFDLTEQTVSLSEKTSARSSGVDGGVERLEREVPTCTEAGDLKASIPAAVPEAESATQRRKPGETLAEEVAGEESLAIFGDIDVPIATQDIRASEQSTDVLSDDDRHVNVLHISVPVKLSEAWSWQLEWYTIPHRHTPNVRSVNSVQTDNPGVDILRLLEEMVYRFCARVGVG